MSSGPVFGSVICSLGAEAATTVFDVGSVATVDTVCAAGAGAWFTVTFATAFAVATALGDCEGAGECDGVGDGLGL